MPPSTSTSPSASTASPALTPEYLAQSLTTTIKIVIWFAAGLPLLMVLLRCYTRLWLRRIFGLDDAFIVAAMVVLLAYACVINAAVNLGLGRHYQVVLEHPQHAISVALLGNISQPLVIMSCALGKTSFALTLMRVAAQRWIHIILWFIIITMNIAHTLVSIFVFCRCKDPRHLWDPTIPSSCWSADAFTDFSLFIGSYSAATDFVLALLPWAMLWGLNMKKREKFGVAVAMSLGVVAGGIAIVKATKLAANGNDIDATWALGPLLLWAGAENGLIIMAACVPTLRPLLRKVFPGSTDKSSENSHPLKNINNLNMFTPKSKQGQWSAIIESEHHPEINSDDQSERSILKQHTNELSSTKEEPERHGVSRIKKTTAVDVTYATTDH